MLSAFRWLVYFSDILPVKAWSQFMVAPIEPKKPAKIVISPESNSKFSKTPIKKLN